MSKLLGLIVSLAVGAGAAYMLDPGRGRHRRALARDKAVAATNRMSEALEGKENVTGRISRAVLSPRRAASSPAAVTPRRTPPPRCGSRPDGGAGRPDSARPIGV